MGTPGQLLSTLDKSAHSFLQPSPDLHLQTLAYLKIILDPVATDVAKAQKLKRDENKKKRKRNEFERDRDVLQLRQVYTNGLGIKQVWEQARRILDATCLEVERHIATHKTQQESETRKFESLRDEHADTAGSIDQDRDVSEDSDFDEFADEDEDEGFFAENGASEEDEDPDEDPDDVPEDLENIEDHESEASSLREQDHNTYVQDPNRLNDGFFSIDDFNKQTQFLEQQDARGEDDNPSDEDEIDWDADPLTMSFHKPEAIIEEKAKRGRARTNDRESSPDSNDEDGPTFGDADLNADDSDDELPDQEEGGIEEDSMGLDNTNEIRYADFFAPPPKKQSKTKRMRALPKTQPDLKTPAGGDDSDVDLQRAMADVRRDLFESDEEESGMETGSDMDTTKPSTKNMSTHEKQRAAVASEIRRLEAANVAKRDWTLSGEARAAERPLNSLIEEDLEFERIGKPVPVITAEVSEELEQLIKRRILAREFDEVIRRRPNETTGADETRRGRIDLDDTKPQSGLAEIYEQEHLKATDPGYVDKRSAATKKQHEEISRLWKEVSSQLDLLSNLHFKPKRVEVEIKAVEDKPTISMEDARPIGVGLNAENSMLAPQEVYRPGEDGKKVGDVLIRKSGASVSKEEMTREEKLRRRRREKERIKKSPGTAAGGKSTSVITDAKSSHPKSKKQDKSDILAELRKGNVKVVGKKGELEDLDGKKGKGSSDAGTLAGGAFKL